jgi:hypothetical protein
MDGAVSSYSWSLPVANSMMKSGTDAGFHQN